MLPSKKGSALENYNYGEGYRNQLSFSALKGWNNDPNGLIYVNGVYHMYYQYNNQGENFWGHMSWGHATSEDLIHWTEQEVAINEGQDGYQMMFSGSVVYDEKNTSGFFETDEDGKVISGSGMVAILTQPVDGVQRQILAYSKDDGNSYTIYGEVLGSDNDGGVGDNEFRDPKVFYSNELNKWLMVVGGGSIRMYASDNLKDWDYLGATGFWGECPDISAYTVNGQRLYALVFSPEDKEKAYTYNKTSRAEAFYPAEYYVVGELTSTGLFKALNIPKRLSGGLDAYAFQSFNNTVDQVYGLSWSASWKNVGSYESLHENYNGGMTVATKMNIVYSDGDYLLTRDVVDNIESLHEELLYDDIITENALDNIKARVADLAFTFDFNDSTASMITIKLRKSVGEEVLLIYDRNKEELTLDRSKSSLIAQDTPYYNWLFKVKAPLIDHKLTLRVLLDRSFISVFASQGMSSIFASIFPSSLSSNLEVIADEGIKATLKAYSLKSIFNEGKNVYNDQDYLSSDSLNVSMNETKYLALYNFNKALTLDYTLNNDNVTVEEKDGFLAITGVHLGDTELILNGHVIKIKVYENALESELDFSNGLSGKSYIDGGLALENDNDAFLFSDTYRENFYYEANMDITGQAAGLVFGLSDNNQAYFVLTIDINESLVKLWKAGYGDLRSIKYPLNGNKYHVELAMQNNYLQVKINDELALIQYVDDYNGGRLGINVYKSKTIFNQIKTQEIANVDSFNFDGTEDISLNLKDEVVKIVNITDASYRLTSDDYFISDDTLTIKKEYLKTLSSNVSYHFRVVYQNNSFDFAIKNAFTSGEVLASSKRYTNDDTLVFTFNGFSQIKALYIDEMLVTDYVLNEDMLVINSEVSKFLTKGSHELKLYTDNGRPTVSFSITEITTSEADKTNSNHLFLIIDLTIFCLFIVGYTGYSIYEKKKGGN